jgi:hypothetical protein
MTEIVADPPGTMVVEGARVLMDSEDPDVGGAPPVVVVVEEEPPLPQPIEAAQTPHVREKKKILKDRTKEDSRLFDAILIQLPSRGDIGPYLLREITTMMTERIISISEQEAIPNRAWKYDER